MNVIADSDLYLSSMLSVVHALTVSCPLVSNGQRRKSWPLGQLFLYHLYVSRFEDTDLVPSKQK